MGREKFSVPNVSPFSVQHGRISKLTSVSLLVLFCCSRQIWHGEQVDESIPTDAAWRRAVGDVGNGEHGCAWVVASMLSVLFVFLFGRLAVLIFVYSSLFCPSCLRFVVGWCCWWSS